MKGSGGGRPGEGSRNAPAGAHSEPERERATSASVLRWHAPARHERKALSCNPSADCDEPTTALDVTIQAQILDLLIEDENRGSAWR